MRTNQQQSQAVELEAYTVDSFCRAFQVGRTTLYDLWAEKRGPKVFYIGSSPRISKSAALEWVRSQEQTAEPKTRKRSPSMQAEAA